MIGRFPYVLSLAAFSCAMALMLLKNICQLFKVAFCEKNRRLVCWIVRKINFGSQKRRKNASGFSVN